MGRLAFALVGVFAVACFDEPAPASGSTDGMNATAGEGAEDADDTAAAGLTITGTVRSGTWGAEDTSPVGGTTVTLVGSSGVSAVTDADGNFTLQGVPQDGVAWLAVAPSMTFIGSVVGVDVAFMDIEAVEVSLVRRADVEMIVDTLQTTGDALDYDAALGGLVVHAGLGESMAAITLDPMAEPGSYFALDGLGTPVLGATTSDFFITLIVYFRVPPGDPGSVQIVAQHPDKTCHTPTGQPPVLADHLTSIAVVCT